MVRDKFIPASLMNQPSYGKILPVPESCIESLMKRELSLEVYSHFLRNSLPVDQAWMAEKGGPVEKKSSMKAGKSHPYHYYNQFRPIFLILKLIGRYPLRVNKKGEYRCSWLSWWMVFCVLNYGLQTYMAVIVCFKRFQALVDSQRDYDEFIFSIHILAYLNIHFHVPFTYWLQADRIANYLQQWADFQDNWAKTFGAPFQLGYQRAVRVYICLVVPMILGFLVFEQYATLRDPILYFLPYLFTIVSTALILALWFCTCLDVRRLTFHLADKLVQRMDSHTTPWLLSRWRLLWLDLRALTESLGTNLCAVLVSIMLTFSTTFLLGLYNGLVQLISYGPSWKATGYLTASLTSLTIILVICDGGHRATTGVISCTLTSLLKGKMSMVNQEIKHEIYLLLEAIKAEPPVIQLGGFVTLNRPLVVSLVANTFTYLIVLLQFKVNEQDQNSAGK